MSEMSSETTFGVGVDPVASQAIYRAILGAFSRPGMASRLPRSDYPSALLPALALADLETGTHLIENSYDTWTSIVAVATGAPAVSLETAKYVTALRPLTEDEFGAVSVGTPLSPESAATVVIAVDSLHGGESVQLIGPGVAAPIALAPHGITTGFWNTRQQLVANFPTGVDLLFVSPEGDLVGIPRTTVVNTLDHATTTAKAN